MWLRVEKGISHREDDFSLRMSSFSPRLSFLPTRSEMTPKRKTAISRFASSFIRYLLMMILLKKYQNPGTKSPQKAVGMPSQAEHRTIE